MILYFFVLIELGLLIGALLLPSGYLLNTWYLFNVTYILAATVSVISCRRSMLSGADRAKMYVCYFTMHFAYGIGWLNGFIASDVRQALRMKNIPPIPLKGEVEGCSILTPSIK